MGEFTIDCVNDVDLLVTDDFQVVDKELKTVEFFTFEHAIILVKLIQKICIVKSLQLNAIVVMGDS